MEQRDGSAHATEVMVLARPVEAVDVDRIGFRFVYQHLEMFGESVGVISDITGHLIEQVFTDVSERPCHLWFVTGNLADQTDHIVSGKRPVNQDQLRNVGRFHVGRDVWHIAALWFLDRTRVRGRHDFVRAFD